MPKDDEGMNREEARHIPRRGQDSRLDHFIRNPFVTIITLMLAILSTAWGLYSHFNPSVERELAFTSRHERVLNYDAVSKRIAFQLRSDEGELIDGASWEGNVFETIFDIWNSGPFPIEKKDVREPLTISVRDGRILAAEILEESHPRISKFTWKDPLTLQENLASSATLNWEAFEKDFGVRIRVLHGSPDPDSVGLSIFISNGTLTDVHRMQEQLIMPFVVVLGGSLIPFFIFLNVSDHYWIKYNKRFRILDKGLVFTGLLFLFCLGLVIATVLWSVLSYNAPAILESDSK